MRLNRSSKGSSEYVPRLLELFMRRRPEPPERPFVFTEDGFSWTADGSRFEVRVTSIDRIETWLADHFTFDKVWLTFFVEEMTFDLSEDTSQFKELLDWLKLHNLISNPDWYDQVTRPAFQTNRFVVFERTQ